MRYIFILIILTILASCEKASLTHGLYGKWNLERTSDTSFPAPTRLYTGSSWILKLQTDNKYVWYKSFSVVESGTYSVNNTNGTGTLAQSVDGTITFTHGDTSYERGIVCQDLTLYLSENDTSFRFPYSQEFQKIF